MTDLRLGVFSDLSYRADGEVISTHQAFILFVTALAPRLEVVLFGRLDPEPGRSHYVLPESGVRFVALPHYPAVTAVRAQLAASLRSARTFAAELPDLDAVWIFGPHPMAMVLALMARRHGKPLFLGVRQDYPQYIRNRLPGPGWAWAVPVAHGLDLAFRRLGRRAPTVALGDELARTYSKAPGAEVLSTGFSLVPGSEVVSADEALNKSWTGPLRVLTVGRMAPEKNPLMIAEVAARLRARDPRWQFVVAGDGPLEHALAQRAADLGVADAIDLRGYVSSGPALSQLYRECHVFLHVSLTEGVPQVLWEAQAAGIPVVATDVGGVRGAVSDRNSILIPPKDPDAAVVALERLRDDAVLRSELIARGLENSANETMERQLDRIVAFFQASLAGARQHQRGGST